MWLEFVSQRKRLRLAAGAVVHRWRQMSLVTCFDQWDAAVQSQKAHTERADSRSFTTRASQRQSINKSTPARNHREYGGGGTTFQERNKAGARRDARSSRAVSAIPVDASPHEKNLARVGRLCSTLREVNVCRAQDSAADEEQGAAQGDERVGHEVQGQDPVEKGGRHHLHPKRAERDV
eukprot:2220441-Rhodomonas_salina.1